MRDRRAAAMRSMETRARWKLSDSRMSASSASLREWIWQRSMAVIEGLERSSRSWSARAGSGCVVLFIMRVLSHNSVEAQGRSWGVRRLCARSGGMGVVFLLVVGGDTKGGWVGEGVDFAHETTQRDILLLVHHVKHHCSRFTRLPHIAQMHNRYIQGLLCPPYRM